MTRHYVEQCLAPGSPLRTAMDDAALPAEIAATVDGRLLARPLFAAAAEMHAFADDVVGLFHLMTSLPHRLFDGDFGRYCAQLRIDPRAEALMRRLGDVAPPLYGRADLYHDGTRFRLLEFNIASELGGIDKSQGIPAGLLTVDAFAAFADAHRLSFTDTTQHAATTLRRAGEAVAPGREPVVALLESPGGMTNLGAIWRSLRRRLRELGLDFHLGEVGDVVERSGKLYLGDVPIDVILRTFAVDETCALPDGEALVEPIFRAHEAGTAVLFTPMASSLYGNKGCLALLSDPRWHDRFSAEELALIDRVLPWTRALGGPSTVDDEDTLAECRERREELILKPNATNGGSGIVPGWETDDEQWWLAIKQASVAGCVVQERVTPRAEPVVDPRTGQVEDWWAVWGMYVMPDGYAGAYARALPSSTDAVISISANASTRAAGVFLYGE
ncbi:hypothetical protein [Dactylosporangium sp. CA-092794]|uniref:hypothetical protein n=1 Tax=Dactylosporangium sp. CA-092794 TaxID=3239929 RepID=UPI003D8D3415